MLWMVHSAWRYRKEILLGIGVVSEMRKTARDFTREYIRRRVKEGLFFGIALILFQLVLLLGALLMVAVKPSLFTRLFASTLLWLITGFNLYRFFTGTIPELLAVRKTLKGKVGYTLKYVLRISVATELMQWNLVMPMICLLIAALTRSAIGTNVSYLAPWVAAFHHLSHAP